MINLTKMNNINNNLKQELINNGYNEMIVNLLVNRGYDEELIAALLTTGYSDEMPKYNDLTNVEIGADIIESHIANSSTIHIFGDYDSDGVNSTYILGDAINNIIHHTNSSAKLHLKVPQRHEGYGMNMAWCERIVSEAKGDALVITVDNGIAQDKEVAYLLENGIDVLITDHHTPNGHVPANVWIIDAHYNNDDENNKGLCGAAVAFKLAMTLLDRYTEIDSEDLYCKYLVNVAIATITDSMPMTIDNIKYVYNGIQSLKDGYGSEAITYYKNYKKNTDITPNDIAFNLGPQINACGRMNNTLLALSYLFSDDENVEDLYNEVVTINDERKSKTEKSINKAEKQLDMNSPSIILELDNVEGIAGIIASNLSSKYNKCTIIFSKDTTGKYLIGSARNDGQIDLLTLLRNINNNSVVKVGGHSAACGITIKAAGLKSFIKAVNEAIIDLPIEEVKEKDMQIVVDDFIDVSDINKDNCEALKNLYFFTESKPMFALTNLKVVNVGYSKSNSNNLKLTVVDANGNTGVYWGWKKSSIYHQLNNPKNITLIGYIEYDFRDNKTPTFNIVDIMPEGEIKYE